MKERIEIVASGFGGQGVVRLGQILGQAAGVAPELFGLGPVPAVRKVQEFLPLVVPMLDDRSARVRRPTPGGC